MVMKLVAGAELAPKHVHVIAENDRLMATARGRSIDRFDFPPLVAIDVPTKHFVQNHGIHGIPVVELSAKENCLCIIDQAQRKVKSRRRGRA
jgi:hypothetical protein